MQRLLIFVLATVLLAACDESRPASVLPHATMVQILSEFHLADAVANQYSGTMTTRDSLRRVIQLQVLQRGQVAPETFYQSYDWYLKHPAELDSVYSDVLRDINKEISKKP